VTACGPAAVAAQGRRRLTANHLHLVPIDGAKWEASFNALTESDPNKLVSPLPVLHVTAVVVEPQGRRTVGYEATLCSYPACTDKHLAFVVTPPVRKGVTPQYWVLRGVALLCITS